MTLEIDQNTVAGFMSHDNYADIIEQYADECAVLGLPHPRGKFEAYKEMEKHGALFGAQAVLDGKLIGFVVVLAPVNLHYGKPIAVVESIFVEKEHRGSGAGLKLISIAKQFAQESSLPGILFSALVGSDLARVLPAFSGKHVADVFFIKLESRAVTNPQLRIGPMSESAIELTNEMSALVGKMEQAVIETNHIIHGGMYARTIMLQAGNVLTSCLIKVPTILTVVGHVLIHAGAAPLELTGFHTLPASAHRKATFFARSDVCITMVMKTNATTVEEAEMEFTDEYAELFSRKPTNPNTVTITGE